MPDEPLNMPIRAAPDRPQTESARHKEPDRKNPEAMTPPVRVPLYEHQIAAYRFVLQIFGAGEGVMPMNISTGKGAALLMEMG